MNAAPAIGIEVAFFRSFTEPGRLFHIRVEKRDGQVLQFTDRFASSVEASQYAIDVANDPCARIDVTAAGSNA